MLDDLFYGNLQPLDTDCGRDIQIQPLMQQLAESEDALRELLDDAGKEKLEAFSDASADLNLLMMKLLFQDGFRIAAGLALDLYSAEQRKAQREHKKACQ